MTRVKRSISSRKKHKKVLSQTAGYYGRGTNTIRIAKQRFEKSMQYGYISRRIKKRDISASWLQQINASSREFGISYSKLKFTLKKAHVVLNNKILATLALNEPFTYKSLTQLVIM